jgi:hypothetical protein
MASSHTVAEYKARNVGNDILLSISQMYKTLIIGMEFCLDLRQANMTLLHGAKILRKILLVSLSKKRKLILLSLAESKEFM